MTNLKLQKQYLKNKHNARKKLKALSNKKRLRSTYTFFSLVDSIETITMPIKYSHPENKDTFNDFINVY